MREATFELPFDIPTTPRSKYYFKAHMKQLCEQFDRPFGDDGQQVGIGFIWETHTGLTERGLNTLSKRMQRALRASGILSYKAAPYFLTQKIVYTRDGDPKATFKLVEED